MNTNEYLEATRKIHVVNRAYSVMEVRPAIICADGLTLSVQAGEYLYCSPRENYGPYAAVEIGFPSQEIPEIMEWAENPAAPTETVYGWVPVEVVDAVIAAHGGIANAPKVLP